MWVRRTLHGDRGSAAVRALMTLMTAGIGLLVMVPVEHWLLTLFGTSLNIPAWPGR